MIAKMNTKNLMVFVAIACALFLVAGVSAYTIEGVALDGVNAMTDAASVIAGENVKVEVWFTALQNDSDVTVEVEFEGRKIDFEKSTSSFDVEAGKKYKKTLTLEVPYELKDEISDDLDLTITIDGQSTKLTSSWTVRVQRPTYNAEVKSVTMPGSVDAGDFVSAEFVIKNRGYNDLDDLYVTLAIPALAVQKTVYLDDLVTIEDCDDDCGKSDTVSGRISVVVPYDAKAGVYAVEFAVSNDDTTSSVVRQVAVNNDFAGNVIVESTKKTVGVGEKAEYGLLLVNPTNKLKVFRLVPETTSGLVANVDQSVVAVPAGSSKPVKVVASADKEGEYTFGVNIFSGETLTSKAVMSMGVEGASKTVANSVANPVVILAIVLSIVFVILLIILIVLITRRPEKAEETGESYY
jgi:hypothetical protein